MIRFPVFRRLTIREYGLFPGTPEKPGIEINFDHRPTLIIGINGLGKTTLVTILLRLLTGPHDLSRRGGVEQLGQVLTEPVRLENTRLFQHRVADGASDATAELVVSFGDNEVVIGRRLADLSLTIFSVNGNTLTEADEKEDYQVKIADLVGVSSFFDVILILRHLVFYLEDRRELVWDPTAQRQLLRLLFLPPDTASEWSGLGREIVSADSSARNLLTIVNRRARKLAKEAQQLASVTDVRAELNDLRAVQEGTQDERQKAEWKLEKVEKLREDARLKHLRDGAQRDEALRDLERIKMHAIAGSFPKASDTARYILTHLVAESECLACGTKVTDAMADLERRLEDGVCVVCGTPLGPQVDIVPKEDVDQRRLNRVYVKLRKADQAIAAAEQDLDNFNEDRRKVLRDLERLDHELNARDYKIRVLARQLPPEERELDAEKQRIETMREQHDQLVKERKIAEVKLEALLEEANDLIRSRHDEVGQIFADYATDFLVEQCRLTYESQRDRLGQVGELFKFPGFSLEMAGGAVSGLTLRRGPDEVSESQREFIDLSFRMALMAVAANGTPTTLVIDAPETSLDVVFAERAGKLLATFAAAGAAPGNRLVVTTNIASSALIPALVSDLPPGEERWRYVVNLFELAASNAAVHKFGTQYQDALRLAIGSEPREDAE